MLISDESGPRSVVIVHDVDGIAVKGMTTGRVADDDLTGCSQLAELLADVRLERETAAAHLAERDVDALAVRRWHLDTTSGAVQVGLELDVVPFHTGWRHALCSPAARSNSA
jgi:hypothetical protein